MAQLTLTSFDQHADNLAAIRNGNNRRWKIATLILVVVCLTLASVTVYMSSRRYETCNHLRPSLETTTRGNVIYGTTTIDGNGIDSSNGSTANGSVPLIYIPASISHFGQYETSFGLSLNHSLFYNIAHLCPFRGFVVNVTFRLFTPWESTHPLYVYRMTSQFLLHQIYDRYPLQPQSDTTDWQTIDIPLGEFRIGDYNSLAIGMQDNAGKNQIYAVRSTVSIHGRNVTSESKSVFPQTTGGFYGVAFTYTVVRDGQV